MTALVLLRCSLELARRLGAEDAHLAIRGPASFTREYLSGYIICGRVNDTPSLWRIDPDARRLR